MSPELCYYPYPTDSSSVMKTWPFTLERLAFHLLKNKTKINKSKYEKRKKMRDLETLSPKGDIVTKSFASGFGEPWRRRGRKSVRAEGMGAPRKQYPLNQWEQAHMSSQRPRQHIQGLHRSAPSSLYIQCDFPFRVFRVPLSGSLSLVPSLGFFSFSFYFFFCPIMLLIFCFIFLYFIIIIPSFHVSLKQSRS